MSDPSATRLLFQRAVLPQGREVCGGEIRIENGLITAVLPEVAAEFEGRTLDRSDCLVLPGFVNAHCHLSLSALAGKIPQDLKFTEWIEQVVNHNHTLPWSGRVAALRRGAQALLGSGVTALGDYLSHPELLVEYAQFPFRQVLFLETLGFQAAVAEERAGRIASVLQEYPADGGARLRLGVAAHSPYAVSPKLFARLRALADRYSCPYSCHTAEVAEEVEFLATGAGDFLDLLRARGVYDPVWRPPGLSPVGYLDRMGQWPLQAVHLNHWTEDDLDLMAERGASAVFCPGSTRWFGRQQWMPVRKLLDRGVAVGLGTDSLASNPVFDFLQEMRLAEEMLPDVSRPEILAMATRHGAAGLGLNAGEITPGRVADLAGFRLASGQEEMSWEKIIFDSKPEGAEWVMVAGEMCPFSGL